MLNVLFNDMFSLRRLSGQRDGHGAPSYKTVVEVDTAGHDTDVPLYGECYVDRRRVVARSIGESMKTVDATLYYSPSGELRIKETDLVVVESTGETYRVDTLREQQSAVEGSEYATVGLTRVKTPVQPNAAASDDV